LAQVTGSRAAELLLLCVNLKALIFCTGVANQRSLLYHKSGLNCLQWSAKQVQIKVGRYFISAMARQTSCWRPSV